MHLRVVWIVTATCRLKRERDRIMSDISPFQSEENKSRLGPAAVIKDSLHVVGTHMRLGHRGIT